MPNRPETLPDRIRTAVAADAPTAVLTALLFELRGEYCSQRSRLLHLLRLATLATPTLPHPTQPPLMAYTFKPAFADVSAIVMTADGPKEVHAANLTDADAEYLIANGQGHLLETVSDEAAEAARAAAKPVLSTRTSDATEVEPYPVAAADPFDPATASDAAVHDEAEADARASQAANEVAADDAQPKTPNA